MLLMDNSDSIVVDPELAERAESDDLHTLGVEEEYLLVDAVEPRAVEAVEEVFDQLPAETRDSVQHDFRVRS